MHQALADIERAGPCADLFEFRLDLMRDPDLPALLRARGDKPCIVTNRTKTEGGMFRGSEEERIAFLRRAIDLGADYIDIEASTPKKFLQPMLEDTPASTQKILSFHDFTRTPDRVAEIYEIMSESPAQVLKIVTYAQDIADNLPVLSLVIKSAREGRKLIAFCMGENGLISRILSTLLGGMLTFGSLETGKESAPGQIPAGVLRDVYRVHQRRPGMKIYGVIGDPVAKSLGYLIHNRAFREAGLPHVYLPFRVQHLRKFFAAFEPWFEGLSVTMPHKETILPLLDEIDPLALKIGAVNTVVRENNRWKGYNTDCLGALRALEAQTELAGKNVLIVGAGGTAKAVGHGVIERGARLTVTYHSNRERGESLARELNCKLISTAEIGVDAVDILINCSPVGMSPDTDATPVPAHHLRPGMVVFDAVYNPPETRLIREAKAAGCIAIPGSELFLNQGAAQFELWTKSTAPREAMRGALNDHLAGPA
jgi:3-dehydroquinate dehydratase/shikimate dehydrogenase